MKKLVTMLLLVAVLLAPAAQAAAAGIRVAVIDTGISTAAISSANLIQGKNYIRTQDSTGDKIGHGTAIASLIVGSASAGVTGVCPTAQLVPLVYCTKDDSGKEISLGTTAVAQIIRDAVDTYGCSVINLSSGSTTNDPALEAAVEYAAQKGTLVVSCAGNSQATQPGVIFYPGGYESVVCVGASNEDGTIASFSQQNAAVDLLAQGVGLRMASVTGSAVKGDGTSYSAGLVSGALAQLWTDHPAWTAQQVVQGLLADTTSVGGWKVLDLSAIAADQPGSDSPYSDVSTTDSYYDAVIWATNAGVTTGTGKGKFSPGATCTRGQVVTFLWRAAGEPQAASGITFSDVAANAYYAQAVAWAVEEGITVGTSGTTFSPNASCTEGQVLTFLWRAMGQPETGTAQGSAYYAQAVAWAQSLGLLEGTFSASAASPRAHIVSYLYGCLGAQ
jgi:hypothetical protein